MSPLYSLRFISIFGSGDLALVTFHGVVSGTVLFDSPISSSPLQVAAEVPVPADGPAALVVGALAHRSPGFPVGAIARRSLGVPFPLTLEPVAKQRPGAFHGGPPPLQLPTPGATSSPAAPPGGFARSGRWTGARRWSSQKVLKPSSGPLLCFPSVFPTSVCCASGFARVSLGSEWRTRCRLLRSNFLAWGISVA